MSRTSTDICNMALAHLGQKPITSIDDTTPSAQWCKRFYKTSIDAVLRSHDWNFAAKTKLLTEITNESVPEWEHLYAIPAGCVFVRKILDESNSANTPVEFEELISPDTSVRVIGTDLTDAYARFTSEVYDESLFDPVFVVSLSYQLASMLAKPLAGDIDLGIKLMQLSRGYVGEAKRSNKAEGNNPNPEYSSILDAR